MCLHSARPLVCTCESGPDGTLHDGFARRTRDINRGCQSLKWRDYLFCGDSEFTYGQIHLP